ncbi:hypothetical protein PENTCL1PPCAC_12173, partial [Pristionchus entomophagus]
FLRRNHLRVQRGTETSHYTAWITLDVLERKINTSLITDLSIEDRECGLEKLHSLLSNHAFLKFDEGSRLKGV